MKVREASADSAWRTRHGGLGMKSESRPLGLGMKSIRDGAGPRPLRRASAPVPSDLRRGARGGAEEARRRRPCGPSLPGRLLPSRPGQPRRGARPLDGEAAAAPSPRRLQRARDRDAGTAMRRPAAGARLGAGENPAPSPGGAGFRHIFMATLWPLCIRPLQQSSYLHGHSRAALYIVATPYMYVFVYNIRHYISCISVCICIQYRRYVLCLELGIVAPRAAASPWAGDPRLPSSGPISCPPSSL